MLAKSRVYTMCAAHGSGGVMLAEQGYVSEVCHLRSQSRSVKCQALFMCSSSQTRRLFGVARSHGHKCSLDAIPEPLLRVHQACQRLHVREHDSQSV